MQGPIVERSKYIYIIAVASIIWEIIDFILINQITNDMLIYYNMLKYSINITFILLFIIVLNKYGVILIVELIPVLNLLPFFIGFAIYSVIYLRYKIRKLRLQPEISYSRIPKIERRFEFQFCHNCGMKIKSNISNCPNCGADLGEKKRFQCPICRSSKLENSIKCPICGTDFHRRCFREWLKIRGTCPVCKNKV